MGLNSILPTVSLFSLPTFRFNNTTEEIVFEHFFNDLSISKIKSVINVFKDVFCNIYFQQLLK